MVTPNEIVWGPGSSALPPGAQMAVVYGDPSKNALFIIQAKFPANYKIPAHWHPTDENVTVLSGSLWMGMGDKLEESTAKAYPVGSFMSMPAKHNHFAFAKEEAVIQVAAIGPFQVNYVNPADDPRNAGKASKSKK